MAASEGISSQEEARQFYLEHLAGSRSITCHGTNVTVVFEEDATHVFSREPTDDEWAMLGGLDLVRRPLPKGRFDDRIFDLDRARHMGHILPAISHYTVSLPDKGRNPDYKRQLHGPKLPDGRYMRVVLRRGPGAAWTCVTAFPIPARVWLAATNSKAAKFPP